MTDTTPSTTLGARREQLTGLLGEASALARQVADGERGAAIAGRLQERLWRLAKAVTSLCTGSRVPPGVVEAAAGLQDLVCRTAEAAPAIGSR